MRSRFEWGLITDVQAPDLGTRIAILRKKAQSDHLQVPDDILEFMASKVSSNIRELEGTLIRVTAFASLNRTAVDMALVQTVLKDLITLDDDTRDRADGHHQPHRGVLQALRGRPLRVSRSQAIATARQIAMYLCREMTSLSLPKIGQLFGNRDHNTVMYANKKITELMKERRSIYNQVTELTSASSRTAATADADHRDSTTDACEGASVDLQPGHRTDPAASSRTAATADADHRDSTTDACEGASVDLQPGHRTDQPHQAGRRYR